MTSKKHLIILILKILESHTDADHTLTQREIAEQISRVHPCERKTVGRNIKFLTEIGYPIVKTGKGFYMDKKVFSVAEVNFIVNTLTSAPESDAISKGELIEKARLHLSKLIQR